MVLNFDLRPRYCVPNIVLNFDCTVLDIRYLPNTMQNFDRTELNSLYIPNMELNSISELDIWCLPNLVLNFGRRARCSVSTEFGAEFRSQSSIFGISRIWCWIFISVFDIRYTDACGAEFRSQSSIFGIYRLWRWFQSHSSILGIYRIWCWSSISEFVYRIWSSVSISELHLS